MTDRPPRTDARYCLCGDTLRLYPLARRYPALRARLVAQWEAEHATGGHGPTDARTAAAVARRRRAEAADG